MRGQSVRMLRLRYSSSSAVSRPIEAGSVAILFPLRFRYFKFVSAPIASGTTAMSLTSRSQLRHKRKRAQLGEDRRAAGVCEAFAVAESIRQIDTDVFERGEADARRLHPVQRERSVGEHELIRPKLRTPLQRRRAASEGDGDERADVHALPRRGVPHDIAPPEVHVAVEVLHLGV